MRIAITGGLGFIGSNYARRLLARGQEPVLIDDLSRPGSDINLDLLKKDFGPARISHVRCDIRDRVGLHRALDGAEVILHLAAQVAVTRSVRDPVEDFEINALGTLNVLEAARRAKTPPLIIYASTNKVYGGLETVRIVEAQTRYVCPDLPQGVPESFPLDFHSPYGCSKGAADQYVRDYCRIFGIPTVVMRQSCIYGPYQFGIGDQGWVAWFLLQAMLGKSLRIFGDGKQVRDLLHVEDLLDLYDQIISRPLDVSGRVYNVGGGATNTLSVWCELKDVLQDALGFLPPVTFDNWRPGDQRSYVSDIRALSSDLAWQPRIDARTGIVKLGGWIQEHRAMYEDPRVKGLLS